MFEETEGKSSVTLVPAIFTERNRKKKKKVWKKRCNEEMSKERRLQKKVHVGEQGASCIG